MSYAITTAAREAAEGGSRGKGRKRTRSSDAAEGTAPPAKAAQLFVEKPSPVALPKVPGQPCRFIGTSAGLGLAEMLFILQQIACSCAWFLWW